MQGDSSRGLLIFVADRLSRRGGADTHLLQMVESAAAAGWGVRLVVGRIEDDVEAPGRVEVVRVRGLASRFDGAAGLTGLRSALAGGTVIHAQNVMNPVAITRIVATGRAVVTVQDHRVFCPGPGKTLPDGAPCREHMTDNLCVACLPDGAYRRRMLDLTSARAEALDGARLVALSDYMAGELARIGLNRVEVLPPWVEVGSPRTGAGDTVLLAGRLVDHKAPLDGWEAWRRSHRSLPLRVAGEGPVAAAMDGAEQLGWLSPAELRGELRRARVLLFPGRWQEPFGILGLEALAEGTPVIAADVGGVGEWAAEGAIVVRPGDVDAMSESLTRLVRHPGEALDLGQKGQRAVATRFSRGVLEPRLLAMWQRVSLARIPHR